MIGNTPYTVGSHLFGFELLTELGQGSFSRVYLARQLDLAGRFVVLKILNSPLPESQTLARLQHSNIVPIYSAHQNERASIICMPYLGATTFNHLFERIRGLNQQPQDGKVLTRILRSHSGTMGLSSGSTPNPEQTVRIRKESPSGTHPSPELLGVLPSLYEDQTEPLRRLEARSYVEAVLWLIAKLCEGLSHAHERGVIHRDVKPSNLLWSEDGQPMLLDFSLAHDRNLSGDSESQVGGTLGYMAPEQLRALKQGRAECDPRSDLYSLGLILWQFLSLEKPCPDTSNDDRTVTLIDRMIEIRAQKVSSVSNKNPQVTPAIEAIVQKCLAHEPDNRYQTAAQLSEDLNRQLACLPLKYAPNRSVIERVSKWARRNPRLSSASTMAVLAMSILLSFGAYSFSRIERQQRYEAIQGRELFRGDLDRVQFAMLGQSSGSENLDEAIRIGRIALSRYGVLDVSNWRNDANIRRLPDAEKESLRQDIGTLLYLMTRAKILTAQKETDSSKRESRFNEALEWNERGAGAFADVPSGSFLRQRSEILRSLGQVVEANRLLDESKKGMPTARAEKALAARELYTRGHYQRALPLLQEAVREDPRDCFSLLLIAHCRESQGRYREAVGEYSACLAVWPSASEIYLNRGLANYQARDYSEAALDFAEARRLNPALTTALVWKALCHQAMGENKKAVEELDRALEESCSETRIYFIRAKNRDALGDRAGAERDRKEGLAKEPTDELSFVNRGYYLLSSDPEKSLADFEAALVLNPRSEVALKNLAHVVGERLKKSEAAIEATTNLIDLRPEQPLYRADRGVYHARLGQCELALKDASEAAKQNPSGEVLYRLGCIHALLATSADDRNRAIHYLSLALKTGFGADYLATDRDLDHLRELPEFRELETFVTKLNAASRPPREPAR